MVAFYYMRLPYVNAEDETQLTAIRRCIKWGRRKRFWDGLDAEPLGRRVGLAKMIAKLGTGERAYVVVEKAARLAEDWIARELLLTHLQSLGVTVIEAVSGLALIPGRPSDHTDVRAEEVALGVAKKDLAALKRRITDLQNGRRRGRQRYGTSPGELNVLKKMRRLRRKPKKGKRMSYATIADELNDLRIPARDGGRWLPGTVAKILNGRFRTT